jgi:endonuclease/exonuclease/phosphatase family metal-dependent hydrolase
VGEVSFDPYQPYGPAVTTSCRVATWNVWGRFGDWQARQKGLISQVLTISPDIFCLQDVDGSRILITARPLPGQNSGSGTHSVTRRSRSAEVRPLSRNMVERAAILD